MRVTTVLLKQHAGRLFAIKWNISSKRKIVDTGLKAKLESMGKPVYDAKQLVGMSTRPEPKIVIPQIKDGDLDPLVIPQDPPLDQTHPDWHDQPCVNYHDHIHLLAGLEQGLNLVKTQVVEKNLPERVLKLKTETSETLHSRVQNAILHSQLYDAAQDKLPRLVDIKRPGWVYPRVYGIPKWRQNVLLLDNLFRICESQLATENLKLSSVHIAKEVKVKVAMETDNAPLFFTIDPHYLFLNKTPLSPYSRNVALQPVPSIYPLKATVNLKQGNIYRLEDHFPAKISSPYRYASLAVFCLNQPLLRSAESNLYGRLLVHTFAVAAAQAKSLYGNEIQDLPEPITLNAVQTDGKHFYFGALQLNSLNIGQADDMAKNLFWFQEKIPLFANCSFQEKRPLLEGYNPEVINTLLAVYRSQLEGQ